MPGVLRPYTLVDVLATISSQSQAGGTDTTVGIGYFAEVDETAVFGEAWTSTVATNATWDAGTWGAVTWT